MSLFDWLKMIVNVDMNFYVKYIFYLIKKYYYFMIVVKFVKKVVIVKVICVFEDMNILK